MIRILIDPGHHDAADNRVGTYSEARTMLAIARKLKACGEHNFHLQVDLTRTDGRALAPGRSEDLKGRGTRSAGCALFLSLHSDASTNPAVRGATVYGDIRPEKADVPLFHLLGEAVARATGIPCNRPRYREDSDPSRYIVHPRPVAGKNNYYAVLRHSRARCACLLELGFHTHAAERALLSDDKVQARIAEELAAVLAAHLGAAPRTAPNPPEFLQRILPDALLSAQKNRILPGLILAQAILESGHGTSELARNANNLFGIKASPPWKGERYRYKGEDYRKYPDIAASVADHGAFFTSTPDRVRRYRGIPGETDTEKAVRALGASGYAQDPAYADKIRRVIREYGLSDYDTAFRQTEKCPCDWSIALLKRIGKHREVKE